MLHHEQRGAVSCPLCLLKGLISPGTAAAAGAAAAAAAAAPAAAAGAGDSRNGKGQDALGMGYFSHLSLLLVSPPLVLPVPSYLTDSSRVSPSAWSWQVIPRRGPVGALLRGPEEGPLLWETLGLGSFCVLLSLVAVLSRVAAVSPLLLQSL